MAWVVLDDFESGGFGEGWTINNNALTVGVTWVLEGTYSVNIDTDAIDYAPNTRLKITHSKFIERNSSDNPTIRGLIYDNTGNKMANNNHTGIMFFISDTNNYYYTGVRRTDSNYDHYFLSKVVDGVETVLSSGTKSEPIGPAIRAVEVKATSGSIVATFYSDTSYSTQFDMPLSTTDTTFTSGAIGISCDISMSAGQGITSTSAVDKIEYFSELQIQRRISKVSSMMGVQSIII